MIGQSIAGFKVAVLHVNCTLSSVSTARFLLVAAPIPLCNKHEESFVLYDYSYSAILNDDRLNIPLEELQGANRGGRPINTANNESTNNIIDWTKVYDLLANVEGSETGYQFDSTTNQRQQYSYFRQGSNEYNNLYSSSFHAYTNTTEYSSSEQGLYANQDYGTENYFSQASNASVYPYQEHSSTLQRGGFSGTADGCTYNEHGYTSDITLPNGIQIRLNVNQAIASHQQYETKVEVQVGVDKNQGDHRDECFQYQQRSSGNDRVVHTVDCFETDDGQVEQSVDSWSQLAAEVNKRQRELPEQAATENQVQNAVVIEEVNEDLNQETHNVLLLTHERASRAESISSTRSISDICFSDGVNESEEDSEVFTLESEEDENFPIAGSEQSKADFKKRFSFRGFLILRTAMKTSLQRIKRSFACCFGQTIPQ